MAIRTVFFGTPQFAVPTLQALLDSPEIKLTGVLTQPNRPAGRGKKLTPSPVKELALQHFLDVLQPEKLKDQDVLPWLIQQSPDAIVVVAYGGFIPKAIRDLSRFGCINLHPSLLPKYRGAAPMQWALINGDKITGISTMILSAGWDDGDILYQEEEPIFPHDNLRHIIGAFIPKRRGTHHQKFSQYAKRYRPAHSPIPRRRNHGSNDRKRGLPYQLVPSSRSHPQ